MKIAITGATGYVGQRLVRRARQAGHEIIALTRKPLGEYNVSWQSFDFADKLPLSLSPDIDAVIHLAALTASPTNSKSLEQRIASELIKETKRIGARFIFISSQTARVDAPTSYGLIKWEIERLVLKAGGLVIRPGQVYGGPELGLFGIVCNFVRRVTILPAFTPAPYIQLIHVDDLAQAILSGLTINSSKILNVASPETISFGSFLKYIKLGRTSNYPLLIPVPRNIAFMIAKLMRYRPGYETFPEKLSSLFALKKLDVTEDLKLLNLTLRPVRYGMTRSGSNTRELIRESIIFLSYVLRRNPNYSLIRRYVRVIETLRKNQPMRLPDLFWAMPWLLVIIDGSKSINTDFRSELSWRLHIASVIAEASPEGAQRFLLLDNKISILRRLSVFPYVAVIELCIRLLRLVLSRNLSQVGEKGMFR